MNENTREAKAIKGQETETIKAGVTVLDEEQLAEVAGGGLKLQYISHICNNHLGPSYKRKSLFGWNWYAKCQICKCEIKVKEGPWSGDPD